MKIYCENSECQKRLLGEIQKEKSFQQMKVESAIPNQELGKSSVVVGENNKAAFVLKQLNERKSDFSLNMESFNFIGDLRIADKMNLSPQDFLKDPADVILSGKIDHKLEIPFTKKEDKESVIDTLIEFTEKQGFRKLIVDTLTAMVHELFNNAVYDAPEEAEKKKLKTAGIQSQSYIFLAQSTDQLIVGCIDDFGSLSRDVLFQRMIEVYEHGPGQSIRMTGGAGIGCHILFERSSSMYIGVEKGRKTVMCCSLPHVLSHKKQQMLPKNILSFMVE